MQAALGGDSLEPDLRLSGAGVCKAHRREQETGGTGSDDANSFDERMIRVADAPFELGQSITGTLDRRRRPGRLTSAARR